MGTRIKKVPNRPCAQACLGSRPLRVHKVTSLYANTGEGLVVLSHLNQLSPH